MKKVLAVLLFLTLITAGVALADRSVNLATLSFKEKGFEGGQQLPVYNGPGYEYQRLNWAAVSTNDTILTAGVQGDWVMVMYQKSGGGFRVGWIDRSKLYYNLRLTQLHLTYDTAEISSACTLTDDPKNRSTSLLSLSKGTQVTVLAQYYDHQSWAYIEVWSDGPMCGFVPMNSLSF